MIIKPQFINDTKIPLPEYPRPQFKRDSYINLNGEWDYAISNNNDFLLEFDGKILVPYSPESELSKVNRQLQNNEFLHYRKIITIPNDFNKGRILLNVGACDQITEIFVNRKFVKRFEGGYYNITADITEYLSDEDNELYIIVNDDASSSIYGRGKQKYKRGGIWYTATSGIWQTIWLESVPNTYIKTVKYFPNFDEKTLLVTADCNEEVKVTILDDKTKIVEGVTKDLKITLDVSSCKPWTPDSPELYTVILETTHDRVESYFGLRKFSVIEKNGIKLTALNNEPIFHNGLLDQGYFHDGHYTPKDNFTLFSDVKAVKDLGFNMLRKHIKVEPHLWYYYCDVLGILVHQDFINGGGEYPFIRIALAPFFNLHINDKNYKKMKRPESSRTQYFKEMDYLMNQLHNTVSLCLWTPFNECWGQFDAKEVYFKVKDKDNSRLIDHASGWQDKGVGDLYSRHIYFRKIKVKNDKKRVLALTEFGGYSYMLENHIFTNKKFGYKIYNTKEKLEKGYKNLFENEIIPLILNEGLCVSVYTQLTDVEDEINGIFTYDRVLKIDENLIKSINQKIYSAFNVLINS